MVNLKVIKFLLEITKGKLFINIIILPSGSRSWTVEGFHIDIAKKLELLLSQSELSCIDPPLNLKNYVCPKYFPFLYNTANKSFKRTKNSWFLLLRRLF